MDSHSGEFLYIEKGIIYWAAKEVDVHRNFHARQSYLAKVLLLLLLLLLSHFSRVRLCATP